MTNTPSPEQAVKLEPCPFCGSPAELEHDSDHHGSWFNLGCSRHWGRGVEDNCLAGRIWYTADRDEEVEAISAWNRRSPPKREAEGWAWLSSRHDLELTFGYPDEEGADGEWQVHQVTGNRSDREWDLIATGVTPLEAVLGAKTALAVTLPDPPTPRSEEVK